MSLFLLFPQHFRLYLSHLEDKQCCLLVDYLLDHPSLSTLDFSHNIIGDMGARAIGKLLTRSKLKILKLHHNNIGGPGAKAIAHALSTNTTLVSLNLRLNRLKNEGGQAICKALLINKTLLHLHLGANEMTACTALSLSKMLAQNKTLKSINLSCNKLGEVRDRSTFQHCSTQQRNKTDKIRNILSNDAEKLVHERISRLCYYNLLLWLFYYLKKTDCICLDWYIIMETTVVERVHAVTFQRETFYAFIKQG